MSLYGIQDTTLTDIADAIRSKTGKTASMTPAEMVDEIESISGGGSSTLIDKTITANGTYSASDDSADGYSSVTVNVPTGGGASSWTKVAETSYQVSTTNTATTDVATWETGHSEIWTSSKWVYIRIRDTAGKRAGYFYGSDQFFMNANPVNESASTSISAAARFYSRYTTYGQFSLFANNGANGYGVYADILYTDGRVRIRSKYSSASSSTIDGTYKVEVYLLDPPTGAPIFE